MPKPVRWTYLALKWLHVSPAGKEGRPGSARFCDCVAVLLVSSGVFAAYLLLHYVLFLLASHPKDAAGIGHELNQFERRQLIEWQPKKEDFLETMTSIVPTMTFLGHTPARLTITARVSFLACHSHIATRPTICC